MTDSSNPLAYMGIKEKNPPELILSRRAPTANDHQYDIGDIWVNQTALVSYQLLSTALGVATWGIITPGASDVDTINALAPVLGDILIDGGTNITDVNAGHTVTLNLNPAITLATSVTSPLYTSAAADVLIQAGGVNDVVLRLGDAAGATFLRVQDSGSADVFTVDSNGGLGTLTADFVDVSGSKITFTQSPIVQSALPTGAAPSGATGDVNILSFQNGIEMEEFAIGAGQTIIAPRMDANGLLVSGDLTTTEGYEYNFGAARANSKHSFTIGTSAAFYLQWRFRVADVSGLEPCYLGFRKTQANDSAIVTYTDFVAYGPNDGISPGDCAISTQLNTGGLTNTDTNDAFADGSTHTLRINVSAAGVVTFLFDGAPPTVTQAFTFDNGDVVHPFFRHTFNAVAPGTIDWISMECGAQ